ncbi:MAG: hypothetical protein JO115_20155 [Pseudonocardiales bacterium]|nr:hypothetical protein [Pseudonocardiales bacterium]
MSGSELLPRTRLEQLVRQLRRTRAEFQRDFIRTADQLDERISVSTRHVARWMAGNLGGLPYPAACRVLEKMFGESAERLFGPPDPARRIEVATLEVLGSVDDPAVQREVAMAASESAHFGQFAEQSNVGPHTLEQFRADLVRIVTTYPNRPVYPLFVEVRALRNRAFELLEGRQYPDQSRELYLVAGALCGVLANASFDLGWLPAAETHARTAFLCAELAGNNALRAWCTGHAEPGGLLGRAAPHRRRAGGGRLALCPGDRDGPGPVGLDRGPGARPDARPARNPERAGSC